MGHAFQIYSMAIKASYQLAGCVVLCTTLDPVHAQMKLYSLAQPGS